MNNNAERLLEVLEKEFEGYDELERMLLRERESLRRPKFGRIEEQLGLKSQLVNRIIRLEKGRAGLMAAISAEQGLDEENVRLLDLLRNTPAPLAGRLMEVRTLLQEKTEKVNRENEINRKVIGSLLSVMNGVMDSLRSVFAEPAMYGVEGKLGQNRVHEGGIVSQKI
ncbi:flagellar protein FlgN [Nitrospinota bacterium]